MTVTVVGVRHHSPACARLVAHLIAELRPAFVLIEGPSDMNDRLAELALPHTLPIALYSFAGRAPDYDEDDDAAPARLKPGPRACFYPFAAHSPEWVALAAARRAGTQALFIDLPSTDSAFDDLDNLYSDRHLCGSERLHELAHRLGFDSPDTLWDHLFEQEEDPARLAPRLRDYFIALRADEPGSPGDKRRERFMGQYVAWAAAQAALAAGSAAVLVICGGYHAPVLARDFAALPPQRPSSPPRPGHHGIFLVPFSFPRLDAFSGYAAGMPSPAFCAAVWEHGPAGGSERMLSAAIAALRARRHPVSAADAISAASLAHGLGRLRGHGSPGRTDLLDGLVAALVKEALVAPLPWARRGTPAAGTHPILLTLLAVFAGDRRGQLAAATPQPPLVADAHAELARIGVPPGRAAVQLEVPLYEDAARGRDHSRVLHRLRILAIPGVRLTQAPRLQRQATHLGERWEVTRGLEFDPALIEAAAYGATLAQAARAKLGEAAGRATAAQIAELLFDAAAAGMGELSAEFLRVLTLRLGSEPDLTELGRTLTRLLRLALDDRLGSGQERNQGATLATVIAAALQRGMWLFAAITGPDAPTVKGHVDAAVALRDAVRWLRQAGHPTSPRLLAELADLRRRDPDSPPYLRGTATGLRAALAAELGEAGVPIADDELVLTFRAMREPSHFGDFLLGLFALARAELGQNDALFAAILTVVEDMEEPAFLCALPALRQALSYFPARERTPIAARVRQRYGGQSSARLLAKIDVDEAVRGRQRELLAQRLAQRFGLEDQA